MDLSASELDRIIEKAKHRCLDLEQCYGICQQRNISFNELCNTVALTIAMRFMGASMTFDDADHAMNNIWGTMVAHLEEHPNDLAEPAYTIYEAFDAGEFQRNPGDPKENPVELYTKPLLKHVLSQ